MLSISEFYGGGIAVSTGTSFSFQTPGSPTIPGASGMPRVWVITMTSTSQTVTLPNLLDPRLSVGIHNLIIINGGANTFTLAGAGFGSISLTTKKGVIMSVYDDGGSKTWAGQQSQWDWRP